MKLTFALQKKLYLVPDKLIVCGGPAIGLHTLFFGLAVKCLTNCLLQHAICLKIDCIFPVQ
jgi:hypothetical protein